jgi:hypothetical protein
LAKRLDELVRCHGPDFRVVGQPVVRALTVCAMHGFNDFSSVNPEWDMFGANEEAHTIWRQYGHYPLQLTGPGLFAEQCLAFQVSNAVAQPNTTAAELAVDKLLAHFHLTVMHLVMDVPVVAKRPLYCDHFGCIFFGRDADTGTWTLVAVDGCIYTD